MAANAPDIFDPALFAEMIAGGFIRSAACLDTGLLIWNYTPAAQYQRVWNDVTRTCRGLITDHEGRVVARPFAKFFNFAEPEAAAGHGPVTVTDKLDGSLGILYPAHGTWRIATRGSFTSAQAHHASGILATRYREFRPVDGWTYLFEIVYPNNKIVVDYGDLDDLVLLGAVDTTTGASVPLEAVAATWPGPVVEVFDFPDLVAALDAPARENREGFVVHFTHPDVRVKVKYAEYVRLHRIVTGLSTTAVFEHLKRGLPIEDLVKDVPDELYDAVRAVADELTGAHATLIAAIGDHFDAVAARHDPDLDRRAFAQAVLALDFDMKHTLFTLADRGQVDQQKVWDRIRPAFRRLGALGADD